MLSKERHQTATGPLRHSRGALVRLYRSWIEIFAGHVRPSSSLCTEMPTYSSKNRSSLMRYNSKTLRHRSPTPPFALRSDGPDTKVCPDCGAECPKDASACHVCDAEFPVRQPCMKTCNACGSLSPAQRSLAQSAANGSFRSGS